MAGLFDAFGVSASDISENPFEITEPNRYGCVVTDSEIKEFGPEGSKKPYWVITYTVKGSKHDGKSANSMHRLVPWTPEERSQQGDFEAMNARLLSAYKKELLNLGIPEEALNAFDPKNHAHRSKIVGIKGTAWFGPQKNNPGFNAVADFSRAEVAEESAPEKAEEKAEEADDIMSALEGWN